MTTSRHPHWSDYNPFVTWLAETGGSWSGNVFQLAKVMNERGCSEDNGYGWEARLKRFRPMLRRHGWLISPGSITHGATLRFGRKPKGYKPK